MPSSVWTRTHSQRIGPAWTVTPRERVTVSMAVIFIGTSLWLELLRYRFGLQELEQIFGAAGFGIRARHVEAAKRMSSDHGAGALAVDVQVPDVETGSRLFDLVA